MVGGVGETNEELLNLAKARGYDVTEHKLTRWRHEGLLARPKQQPLGKGHGTRTIYPPGTGEQLLTLCEVHAEERRLLHVAWRLWWAGYEVAPKPVRAFLARAAAEWDRRTKESVDPKTGGLSESALKLLDEAPTARYDAKFLRRARKRVGSQQFGTLMGVMLGMATGAFDGYLSDPTESPEEDEQRIIEKGLGLGRGRAGRRADPEARLSDGVETTLKEGSRLFGEHPFGEVLTAVTDTDLIETRDWARSMTIGAELIGVLARETPGSEASGLSAMSEAFREAGPPEQAILLLSLLSWRLRGPGSVREKMDSYHEQVQQVLLKLRELEERQDSGVGSFLHLYAKDARASGHSESSDESR